jgi:hypothetical protein
MAFLLMHCWLKADHTEQQLVWFTGLRVGCAERGGSLEYMHTLVLSSSAVARKI